MSAEMESEPKLRWQDPEWLRQATDWIAAETRRAELRIDGPIEQPHIYPWSTVLRVPTNEGTLFFKATAEETVYEAGLTRALASWYPDCMPELVSVDAGRGWMLMRDGGEPLRAQVRPKQDITPWDPIIRRYADVQVGLTERVEEMLALGVPDWRLARLPALYGELVADTEILRLGRPDGLTEDEYRRMRELPSRFTAICSGLAAFDIPESLNHGDLHDGNVLIKNERVTFFDWGDGNVTHPFASLRTFFVSIENSLKLEDYAFTPGMESLLRSYIEPWRAYASEEDLLKAFSISRCVATVVKALAWRQTVSRLDGALRTKYEHILPELAREFLTYEKMLSS